MQRYFVCEECIFDDKIIITKDDAHHIQNVMRMRIGDKIYVANNNRSWICQIVSFFKDHVETKIIEQLHENKELPVKVGIAHGVVRREKMEEVIEKISELGASMYYPVNMERSNVKIYDEKLDRKLERMNKIAKEACEQSHRTALLEVNKPISFNDFINLKKDYDLCLYAYEVTSKDLNLKKLLKENKYNSILVLIGPEGGISDNEVKILNKNGFLPISLGPRILRTQVAPTYVLSVISYELEV